MRAVAARNRQYGQARLGRPRLYGRASQGDAAKHGIELQVVKLAEAKKGFVLLPRRWVVERSFSWLACFKRLSRDFERLPEVLAGLHFVVFAMLMLPKVASLLAVEMSS